MSLAPPCRMFDRSKTRIGARIMPDNRQDAPKLSHAEPLDEAAMRTFYSNVRGQVILPDDAIYKEARTVFYGGFDPHPAALVPGKDTPHIPRVVSPPRESGLGLALKSGGPNPP